MTRLILLLTIIFPLSVLTGFQKIHTSTKYDWTKIKEFKFYGYINPDEKKDAQYILADTDKIKKIFSQLKSSEGFLPKGAERFATISFENKKKITIQVIAGGHLQFRIIKKKLFTDDWFEISENNLIEWTDYLNVLTTKIEK